MIRLRELSWLIVLGVSAFAALLFVSGVILGGPLDPPGPPAPTMKTLSEVEPRTPISALPFTIATPGSYYVTGNLSGVAASHGITISASNVTLDLRGYTLTGVGGSLDGIHINGSVATPITNVMITNGAVDGWGDDGIGANTFPEDGGALCCLTPAVTVDNVRALNNVGDGIILGVDSIVRNSIAYSNDDDGIETSIRGRIEGNFSYVNTGDGIVAAVGTMIIGNKSQANGFGGVGAGIADFGGAGERHIEGNNVVANDTGIAIASAGNVIIKNTASLNTAEYAIAAGNTVGPIETAATPLTNPWANIDY